MSATYQLIRYAQQRHRAFTEVVDHLDESKFHFSAKDNLCADGFQARAGSAVLDGYNPPSTPLPSVR